MSFLLAKCKELDYSSLVSINGGCSGSASLLSGAGGANTKVVCGYPGNSFSGFCSGSSVGTGSSLGLIKITKIDSEPIYVCPRTRFYPYDGIRDIHLFDTSENSWNGVA